MVFSKRDASLFGRKNVQKSKLVVSVLEIFQHGFVIFLGRYNSLALAALTHIGARDIGPKKKAVLLQDGSVIYLLLPR